MKYRTQPIALPGLETPDAWLWYACFISLVTNSCVTGSGESIFGISVAAVNAEKLSTVPIRQEVAKKEASKMIAMIRAGMMPTCRLLTLYFKRREGYKAAFPPPTKQPPLW